MTRSRHRVSWKQEHVVDVRAAAFAARIYYEQRDLRRILSRELASSVPASACDIGAGFGRMSPVLTEVSRRVVAFEREPEFVLQGKRLFPDIDFQQVTSLGALPAANQEFELALTFTVLQHITNGELPEVIAEIRRILAPGALLVTCEETDPEHRAGDIDDRRGMCTIGRTVDEYRAAFAGFDLVATDPRRIEPTYPRSDVGMYMTWRKRSQ